MLGPGGHELGAIRESSPNKTWGVPAMCPRIHFRGRRARLSVTLAALVMTFLGVAPVANAATPPSSTAPSNGQNVAVFADRNVKVTVSGGTATAMNKCVNDATDGVIQLQRTACRQVAAAGNLVDITAITVYQSKNTTITVSGGTATAINECVNDATDGVIQTQQNACRQAAVVGNVVTVADITVSASKNTTITVSGGTATAINECVNNASGGSDQTQQNACIQLADAGSLVNVGDINITDSKNITIDVTGGTTVTVFTCASHATGPAPATQSDTCTQTATVGTTTSLGNIKITDSKNITVTLDGTVVTGNPNARQKRQ